MQNNKENDNDWFKLESNKDGTKWFGKVWYIHELLKYEFDIEFDVSYWKRLPLNCETKLIRAHYLDSCYLPHDGTGVSATRTRR